MHTTQSTTLRRALPSVLFSLGLLLLWEMLVRTMSVPQYVLPAPSAIAQALVAQWPSLQLSVVYTLKIMWVALLLAVVSGVGLAILIHRSRLVEAAVLPLAIVLQVTPVVAIAPLVMIWVGVDKPDRTLIILAWIVAFFPMLSGTMLGLKSILPEQRDLFALYGARGWTRLWLLDLPAILPDIIGGLKIAAGLALMGAVVAEFVAGAGTSLGLAWRLIEAGNRFEVPTAFACLLLLALIGLAHYALLHWVEYRVLKQRGLGQIG